MARKAFAQVSCWEPVVPVPGWGGSAQNHLKFSHVQIRLLQHALYMGLPLKNNTEALAGAKCSGTSIQDK